MLRASRMNVTRLEKLRDSSDNILRTRQREKTATFSNSHVYVFALSMRLWLASKPQRAWGTRIIGLPEENRLNRFRNNSENGVVTADIRRAGRPSKITTASCCRSNWTVTRRNQKPNGRVHFFVESADKSLVHSRTH